MAESLNQHGANEKPRVPALVVVGNTALNPPELTEEQRVVNPFAATFIDRYCDETTPEQTYDYIRGAVTKMMEDTGGTTRFLPEQMVRRNLERFIETWGNTPPDDPVRRQNRRRELEQYGSFAVYFKDFGEVFAARALSRQLHSVGRPLLADTADMLLASYGKTLVSLNRTHMQVEPPSDNS